MNPIRHIRRFAGVLAGLAGLAAVLVASGATPAFAMVVPPPGGPAGAAVPPAQASAVHTIVAGGMPGWQITLIAVGPPCSRPRSRCSSTAHGPPAGTRSPRPPEPSTQTTRCRQPETLAGRHRSRARTTEHQNIEEGAWHGKIHRLS